MLRRDSSSIPARAERGSDGGVAYTVTNGGRHYAGFMLNRNP